MNIFAGNLSFDATEADVKKLFAGFGNVASVVIVMEKEKKAPKSRGFGFVQMPDEQQAFAAIAALNGKEFMDRVLNVNPARPKTEAQAASKLKEKRQPKVTVEDEKYPRVNPGFRKLGTYKGGRRSRSYVKRHGLTGMQEDAKLRRKSQDNPMRWRKRKDQPKPWQKSLGEHKPWKKVEEGARPWKKTGGEIRTWRKPGEESKPWKKSGGESRPWKKAEGESKPWRKPEGGFKPWKKTAGDAKPWRKSTGEPKPLKRKEGEYKPWRKSAGELKPWRKSNKRPRPRQSRIESRRKPGGYKR